jgi:hypothetical protein
MPATGRTGSAVRPVAATSGRPDGGVPAFARPRTEVNEVVVEPAGHPVSTDAGTVH